MSNVMEGQEKQSSLMKRDLDNLIASIEMNGIHMKATLQKAEDLTAAMDSSKEIQDKLKSRKRFDNRA